MLIIRKKLTTNIYSCFFIILSTLSINGQENNLTKTDSLSANMPVAINIVDIIGEIRETNSELKLISRKAETSSGLIQIDTLYSDYRTFLIKQQEITESFIKSNPNRQKIDNRIKKWFSYSIKLQNWENLIDNYTSKNSELVDDLNSRIETWNLTLKNAKQNKAPAELISSVINIRDDLINSNKSITQNTSKYLRLGAKIDRLVARVDENVDALEKFKKSESYHLLYKRHSNIWAPEVRKFDTNDDGKETLRSYKSSINNFFEYIKAKPNSIAIYLFYIGIIFLILRYFKNSFIKYPLNDYSQRLKRFEYLLLKQSKLATAFLVILLIRFLLIGGERFFIDVLIIGSMITAIPIIKPYEPKKFRSFFMFIVALYIMDAFKTYAWFSSLEYRLYLFAESIVAIVLILKFTSPTFSKIRKFETKRFSKALQLLRPLLLSFLIIAIVSNIFGYTNLTDTALIVTIQSFVLAIMGYGLLLVFESCAISIIHRHYELASVKNFQEQIEIEKKVIKTFRIIIVGLWTFYFINIIGKGQDVYTYLELVLSEKYTIGSISFTLGSIFSFFIVLFISYFLSRIVSFLINEGNGALKVFKFSKGVPTAISVVIRYIIIGFGFVFAISLLGIDLSTFNLMAGALGLGIGFGLQTIISNFVSGIILIFERPILPGDSVQVDELFGTVSKIGIRASVISTYDGAEVIVPNNNLISNDLINWTLSSSLKRIQILIGTAYGSDPNEVLEIIKNAAISNEFVLKDPQPMALFDAFGDSSLNFILRFWVHFENGLQAKSEVSIAIYNGLHEANIEIPFPQRDINIKSAETVKTEETKPLIPPKDNT